MAALKAKSQASLSRPRQTAHTLSDQTQHNTTQHTTRTYPPTRHSASTKTAAVGNQYGLLPGPPCRDDLPFKPMTRDWAPGPPFLYPWTGKQMGKGPPKPRWRSSRWLQHRGRLRAAGLATRRAVPEGKTRPGQAPPEPILFVQQCPAVMVLLPVSVCCQPQTGKLNSNYSNYGCSGGRFSIFVSRHTKEPNGRYIHIRSTYRQQEHPSFFLEGEAWDHDQVPHNLGWDSLPCFPFPASSWVVGNPRPKPSESFDGLVHG